jgi:hypothetical protein
LNELFKKVSLQINIIMQKSSYCKETGESYMDFDWNEFVEKLFQQSPQDPFTYRMEFLEEMDAKKLSGLLGAMLIKGAKQLYSKEIAQLTPQEIETLQRYYRSIGFEVEYDVETKIQYVEGLKKTIPVNRFHIDFKPCSQLFNNYNKPEKLI